MLPGLVGFGGFNGPIGAAGYPTFFYKGPQDSNGLSNFNENAYLEFYVPSYATSARLSIIAPGGYNSDSGGGAFASSIVQVTPNESLRYYYSPNDRYYHGGQNFLMKVVRSTSQGLLVLCGAERGTSFGLSDSGGRASASVGQITFSGGSGRYNGGGAAGSEGDGIAGELGGTRGPGRLWTSTGAVPREVGDPTPPSSAGETATNGNAENAYGGGTYQNFGRGGIFIVEWNVPAEPQGLGPELVINGNFDNGSSGWTVYAPNGRPLPTISGGRIYMPASDSSSNTGFYRNETAPSRAGATHRLTFDYADLTTSADYFRFQLPGGTYQVPGNLSGTGTHSVDFAPTEATSGFTFQLVSLANRTGYFDNFSVREVTGGFFPGRYLSDGGIGGGGGGGGGVSDS